MRVVTVPDSCPCGMAFKKLAEVERSFAEQDMSYTWAQMILAILTMPNESMPAGCAQILKEHAQACNRPECVRDCIMEYSATRTYAGESSNIRMAVNGGLQQIALAGPCGRDLIQGTFSAKRWRLCSVAVLLP